MAGASSSTTGAATARTGLLSLPDEVLQQIVEQCTLLTKYDPAPQHCPICGADCRLFSEMPPDEFDYVFPPLSFEALRDCSGCGAAAIIVSASPIDSSWNCCHSCTRAAASALALLERPNLLPPSAEEIGVELVRHFPHRRPSPPAPLLTTSIRLNRLARESYYGNNVFSFCLVNRSPIAIINWLKNLNLCALPCLRHLVAKFSWTVKTFAQYMRLLAFIRPWPQLRLDVEFQYLAQVPGEWESRQVTMAIPQCMAERARVFAHQNARASTDEETAPDAMAAQFWGGEMDPAELPLTGCACEVCSGSS